MTMLAIFLAAAVDAERICAKYASYKPPAAAVAAEKACGDGCGHTLPEIFANGTGVKRDYTIAEYFLCRSEDDMAPAEFDGMMEHLQQMRAGKETQPLRFCDHVTSGYGMTYCAHIQWDEAMPTLDARLDKLRGTVPPTALFDALRTRAYAFAEAEVEQRTYVSRGGTGYPAFTLTGEIEEKERVVAAMERFSKTRASATDAAQLRLLDDELNAEYRDKRAYIDDTFAEEAADWKALLRDAQRAWIEYRDAFAAYYVERWRGKGDPDALRREIVAALTHERKVELSERD